MPQNKVSTTSTVGAGDIDGEALAGVGMDETVGLVDGCGPSMVGALVGAGLRHLSVLIP